jgi:hypothetical protein
VTEGDDVRIECQIGFAQCERDIYWFFNNKLVEEFYSSVEVAGTSTRFSRRKAMILRNVTKADEGLYECLLAKAEDRREALKLTLTSDYQEGRDQIASQYIRVLKKSQPKIYSNFKENDSISLPSGYKFELVCEVSGNPKPILKWFKGSGEIEGIFGEAGRVFAEGFKLVFESFESEDAGSYSCLATNEVGRDENY